MGGRREGNFISIFAIMDPLLLREAGTKRVRQIQCASTAVHAYAASDVRVRQCLYSPFRKNIVLPPFLRQQHVCAEHSHEEEGVGEDATSEVCFGHDGSFACLSKNRARQ